VTQRTLARVDLPEAALLRFATASSRDAIPQPAKVDKIDGKITNNWLATATFRAPWMIKWEK
jgi:hypothetical protein